MQDEYEYKLRIEGGVFNPRLGIFEMKEIYNSERLINMKTKEIEVWLDPDHVDQIKRGHLSQFNNGIYFSAIPVSGVKAKLIIELPERKVTISESEFDKAWDHARTYKEFQDYKQKLFGGEG